MAKSKRRCLAKYKSGKKAGKCKRYSKKKHAKK